MGLGRVWVGLFVVVFLGGFGWVCVGSWWVSILLVTICFLNFEKIIKIPESMLGQRQKNIF